MEPILVILCYFPWMRILRRSLCIVTSSAYGLGFLVWFISGQIMVRSIVLVVIPTLTWIGVELWAAVKAYQEIDRAYTARQLSAVFADDNGLDYDESQGLNLSPEDFFDQDD